MQHVLDDLPKIVLGLRGNLICFLQYGLLGLQLQIFAQIVAQPGPQIPQNSLYVVALLTLLLQIPACHFALRVGTSTS